MKLYVNVIPDPNRIVILVSSRLWPVAIAIAIALALDYPSVYLSACLLALKPAEFYVLHVTIRPTITVTVTVNN